MNSEDLRKRLKIFALRIIKLSESLPNNNTGNTLGRQIIRSGTSLVQITDQHVWENRIKIFSTNSK